MLPESIPIQIVNVSPIFIILWKTSFSKHIFVVQAILQTLQGYFEMNWIYCDMEFIRFGLACWMNNLCWFWFHLSPNHKEILWKEASIELSIKIKFSDFECNQKNFHRSFYSGYLKNKSSITLFYEEHIFSIQKPLTIPWKLFEWRCKFFNLFSISICFHFDRKCEIHFPTAIWHIRWSWIAKFWKSVLVDHHIR